MRVRPFLRSRLPEVPPPPEGVGQGVGEAALGPIARPARASNPT
jgi:hypothetical protein